MRLSAYGHEFLKAREGLRLEPYKDKAGLGTVGYGHLITPIDVADHRFAKPMTREEAAMVFEADVHVAERAVENHVVRPRGEPPPLDQHEFDALVSFAFNVGEAAFATSGVCKAVNEGRMADVPARLAEWNKIHKGGRLVPDEGLTKRRALEAALWNGEGLV